MTVRVLLTALVRSVVPAIVGALVALASKVAGVTVDEATLSLLVDAVVIGGLLAGFRYAENRYPFVKKLLEWKAQPKQDIKEG